MRAFTVTVDDSGRILLPANVRKQLNLGPGSKLLGRVDRDNVSFKSRAQALKEAQAYFSSLRRGKELWSEEIIRDRRREARRHHAG